MSRELVHFKISGEISVPDGFEPVLDCGGNVTAFKKDGIEVRLIAGIEIESKDNYKAICCETAMEEEGFILIDYEETVFEV